MPIALTLSAACERAGVPLHDRFTAHQVARVLDLPDATVRRLMRSGRLPAVRYTAKAAFVLADDLSAFMARAYSAQAA